MRSLGKTLSKFMVVSALIMCMSLVAFADTEGYWQSFAVALPAHQGDIEIGPVARANSNNTAGYFTITIRQMQTGNAVRAWAENSSGGNLSSPYNFAYVGTQDIYYYNGSVPSAGTNVTLNLDNPYYSNSTVSVLGSWTPN